MKKTMKIYMAAALLAVVSPAILAQAPVKVFIVCFGHCSVYFSFSASHHD